VDGSTLQAIRVAHDAGTRSTLFDIRPDLPDALVRAAETAINPDPLKRYKSAGQMIAALHDAIGLGGSPAIPAPKRKSRWLFAAIPFVIVAAAAFLMRNATPIAAVEDDYLKAHDLVDHYYRPYALETAIPLLEKTVAKDPHFAPAFADLGRANLLQFTQLRDTKYIEPAREASLHALRIKRDLVSAHVTLGILYTRTSKNDLASQQLDEALKIDKFNASAYAALGNLYLSEGRNSEGEEMLQKAATLDPGNWGILVELGSFYDESGKYAKAAEQYQRAADLAPDNARAQNNLGYVSRLQGHFQEADAAYRKAIALEPTAGHYRNLGQVLLEQGSYSEAGKMLEHAVQLKPDDYRAWGFLATVYASTGIDRPKVEATYRKAIALGKGLGQTTSGSYVLADLGNYYAALGVARQSESLLKQAVAGQPDSPQLLYEVAAGYELLHQREQSLLWIGKAIDAGVSPQFLMRIPQLTSLRADPRYPKTK
jgi:Tfp pilus assembly protein PilF